MLPALGGWVTLRGTVSVPSTSNKTIVLVSTILMMAAGVLSWVVVQLCAWHATFFIKFIKNAFHLHNYIIYIINCVGVLGPGPAAAGEPLTATDLHRPLPHHTIPYQCLLPSAPAPRSVDPLDRSVYVVLRMHTYRDTRKVLRLLPKLADPLRMCLSTVFKSSSRLNNRQIDTTLTSTCTSTQLA